MDSIIKQFFEEIDLHWGKSRREGIKLSIIGSSAIMMQMDYSRPTKDSDVLETQDIGDEVENELLRIAGKGSELSRQFRLYLDFVKPAIPFLPQKPAFVRIPSFKTLKHIEVQALDLTDLAVSKLKRFNANDVSDVHAMVRAGRVSHSDFIERFKRTADYFLMDARAVELPRYVKNLHVVERDFFNAPETDIELPSWI